MSISGKDLIKIIKTCRASNVSDLKIGDVEIKFHPGDAVMERARPSEIAFVPPSTDELEAEQKHQLLQENLEDVEVRVSQLQIEDPSLYERLLIERELESVRGEKAYD